MSSNYLTADNGVSSGVTGITQSAGNDGTLQIRTTTSGGTATTAVTVDNAQNVGVGVTPSAWSTSNSVKAVQFTQGALWGYSTTNLFLGSNYYFNGTNRIYSTTAAVAEYSIASGAHTWYNAPSGTAGTTATLTQAMTLDASGNFLVGATSRQSTEKMLVSFARASNNGGVCITTDSTASTDVMTFRNNGGTVVGTINTNGSLTSYNVSSDYRLKENIAPLTGALNKISALKPSLYNYKADPSTQIEGFIAHELAEVVPHAVTGEKDAIDGEGNPVYQGVDVSFLIPHLVASIQELSAQVTSLQATVETQATTIATLQNKIGA